MNFLSLVFLGITVSMFFAVLAIGVQTAPSDWGFLLSKPARLFRSLLAMSVLAPIVTIGICKTFSLHPAVIVALVTLSVAPVGTLFSKEMLPMTSTERIAYARGLFFASAVLSVLLTPLSVEVIQRLFGEGEVVHISPAAVARVVLGPILLPLAIGMAIRRWRPSAAPWIAKLDKAGSFLLLVCGLVILATAWPLMVSVVRYGTLTAITLITLSGLAAGHFLGGPNEDDRTVLAFATASRHPGAAVAIGSLTDQSLAPIGVLVAVLVSSLAVVPYKIWRKKRRTAGPAAGRTRTAA